MTIETWVKKIFKDFKKDDRLHDILNEGHSLYNKLPSYKNINNYYTYHELMQEKHELIYESLKKVYEVEK